MFVDTLREWKLEKLRDDERHHELERLEKKLLMLTGEENVSW